MNSALPSTPARLHVTANFMKSSTPQPIDLAALEAVLFETRALTAERRKAAKKVTYTGRGLFGPQNASHGARCGLCGSRSTATGLCRVCGGLPAGKRLSPTLNKTPSQWFAALAAIADPVGRVKFFNEHRAAISAANYREKFPHVHRE